MVKEAAWSWSIEKGSMEKRITKATEEVHRVTTQLQQVSADAAAQRRFQDAKKVLQELQEIECQEMRQCAHVDWLLIEDQLTAFFARMVKTHHTKNSLMQTMDTEGNQTNSLAEMKNRAVLHFQHLYSSTPRQWPIVDLNITFEDAISPEMSTWFQCYPTVDKIRNVHITMLKNKALGLDSMMVEVLAHH